MNIMTAHKTIARYAVIVLVIAALAVHTIPAVAGQSQDDCILASEAQYTADLQNASNTYNNCIDTAQNNSISCLATVLVFQTASYIACLALGPIGYFPCYAAISAAVVGMTANCTSTQFAAETNCEGDYNTNVANAANNNAAREAGCGS